jgi:hypothetical protein
LKDLELIQKYLLNIETTIYLSTFLNNSPKYITMIEVIK